MKSVNLIKISSSAALVDDYENQVRLPSKVPIQVIPGSDTCLVDSYAEVDFVDIKIIVDQGVDRFIAVESKVWEYLYLIENPITAEKQEQKIRQLKNSISILRNESDLRESKLTRLKNTSLWSRVKWVFTGVKL